MSEFFAYPSQCEKIFKDYGTLVKYDKGTHLVWNNDDSDWVFFLVDGFVEASFKSSDGTPRIIGYFPSGSVFAQSGSFFNSRDNIISYTARTASKVYRMKNKKFLAELTSDTALMSEYLQTILRGHIFLIERIIYTGEKDLYRKCVHWLLFMKKFYGKKVGKHHEIQIPMTQEIIANFIHTTRESLNPIIRELVENNLISVSKKKITITDLKGLQAKLV